MKLTGKKLTKTWLILFLFFLVNSSFFLQRRPVEITVDHTVRISTSFSERSYGIRQVKDENIYIFWQLFRFSFSFLRADDTKSKVRIPVQNNSHIECLVITGGCFECHHDIKIVETHHTQNSRSFDIKRCQKIRLKCHRVVFLPNQCELLLRTVIIFHLLDCKKFTRWN